MLNSSFVAKTLRNVPKIVFIIKGVLVSLHCGYFCSVTFTSSSLSLWKHSHACTVFFFPLNNCVSLWIDRYSDIIILYICRKRLGKKYCFYWMTLKDQSSFPRAVLSGALWWWWWCVHVRDSADGERPLASLQWWGSFVVVLMEAV